MAQRIVGESVKRLDAVGKVTGATFYPGIVAVFTAKDVPVNEYGLIMKDQPVLCGPGSDKEGADIVRTTMDNIALVVAETEEAAAAALRLIKVDYEDLPAVFDPYEAMQPDAPQLHSNTPQNVIVHYRIRKGDMDAGWQAADVVVEGTYSTSWQEHAYLQPEAGLAYRGEEGRITVQVAGQGTHEDQEQICHSLGVPPEKVRVIYPAIGGAFGGREDMSVQIVLALATWKLNRPVKIIWSREESVKGHHKRHPIFIKTKWGATREGKIVAAEAKVVGDAGAYAYTSTKVLGNATLMCTGPYEIPNVHVDTYAVYTNNLPSGAFRGFGGPQGAFAAEGQMNKLAEALGMDPVELRLKSILRDGALTSVGTPLPQGVTIRQVIEECALQSGYWKHESRSWERPPASQQASASQAIRHGIGFAAAFKNVGFSFGFPERCDAIIELHGGREVERVVLRHAGAEVGQGVHTVMAQMTAEAVGVSLDKVELVLSDTASSGNSGSASASRMTFMAGNSIRGAADAALAAWHNEERPAIGAYQYRPPRTTMYDPQTGKSEPNFAYGYVAEAVEVEVDLEMGFVRILNVVCADDVGRAVNPMLVQGQIEGAVVQAQGYALMENFQTQDGHVLTPYLSSYLIPTVLDIPDHVQSVILEYDDPIGPCGARGKGELPYLPFAPAVAAAIHDATGIWFDSLPMIPERLVKRFREAGLGA